MLYRSDEGWPTPPVSHEILMQLTQALPMGLCVTDGLKNCVLVNDQFSQITGLKMLPSAENCNWIPCVGASYRPTIGSQWEKALRSRSGFTAQFGLAHSDTAWAQVVVSCVRGARPDFDLFVCAFSDISQARRAEQKIQRMAFFDDLTNLPNRRLLLDRLSQVISGLTRQRESVAVLFLDLDNFKALNDTYGHDKGDLLLKQVAKRLKACVREVDTVARLGGDEFVAVLCNLSVEEARSAQQAEKVAEKIITALNKPYLLGGVEHYSTPSIGISLVRDAKERVEELLKRTDMAMYQAKAAGRNTWRFFDPDMQLVVAARTAMEAELRAALQRAELCLHYQPQVDAHGHVFGAEAFLRWAHPSKGFVSPAAFIPLAEETGLMIPIGQWLISAACDQLVQWASSATTRELTLTIKVSAQHFRQATFVAEVHEALQRSTAPVARLKLEINENLLMADVDDVIEKTQALSALGIGISLADLGTGYSSLSHLKRLALEQLRIDQTFVRGLLTDSNDEAVARSIFALAASMNLRVSAEGVETAAQRTALLDQGCTQFQGYLFCRPIEVTLFEQMLANT
jgi:diguanylate cyclase (GGDEF)-like protein